MASEAPQRMAHFTKLHELSLQQMCLTDDELASAVLPHLTVETDRGPLTGAELAQHPIVRVSRSVDEFRQLAALLPREAPPLVNGGFLYTHEITRLMERLFDGVRVESADIDSVVEALEAPPLADTERAQQLHDRLATIFASDDIRPLIRAFEPSDIPAVLLTDRVAATRRERRDSAAGSVLWTSLLGAIDKRHADINRAAHGKDISNDDSDVLCLNWSNSLVRRLSHADDTALDRCAQILRVQALTSSRRPLSRHDRHVLSTALGDLVDLALKCDDFPEEPK